MDNQEAINLLNELLLKGDFTDQWGDICDSSPYEVAVDIAVKAIEKQIKKTVLKDNIGTSTSYIGSCPICNRYAGVNNVQGMLRYFPELPTKSPMQNTRHLNVSE